MSFSIQYPTTSPTHTSTLRSPELGESLNEAFKTSINITMDASLATTQRTPTIQKCLWNFRDIPTDCDDQLSDLKSLLTAAKGRDVQITDHNSDIWTGKIINNPLDIIHTHIGKCSFTLEFIGTKETST